MNSILRNKAAILPLMTPLKYLLVLIVLFSSVSFKMQERLEKAKLGSYVLTEQNNVYSLLFLQEKTKDYVLIEEVLFPKDACDASELFSWLERGAPHHYSWIEYAIDRVDGTLIECFSLSKNSFLPIEGSDLFLSTLLSLPFSPVPMHEQKKVGPAPLSDEEDRRPLWTPTLFKEGKKYKVPCNAVRATWPKDESLLSSCSLLCYFPKEELSPFPLWIEASNGHLSYAIHATSFGLFPSPLPHHTIPKRPMRFLHHQEKHSNAITLSLFIPRSHKSWNLFAFDILDPQKLLGPFPCAMQETALEYWTVTLSNLNAFLQKGHTYTWVLQSEISSWTASEEVFSF